MKRQTIRFYTDNGIYKGWQYLNKITYHNMIVGWLRSGNVIKIDNKTVTWINKNIFLLNSHYYSLIK